MCPFFSFSVCLSHLCGYSQVPSILCRIGRSIPFPSFYGWFSDLSEGACVHGRFSKLYGGFLNLFAKKLNSLLVRRFSFSSDSFVSFRQERDVRANVPDGNGVAAGQWWEVVQGTGTYERDWVFLIFLKHVEEGVFTLVRTWWIPCCSRYCANTSYDTKGGGEFFSLWMPIDEDRTTRIFWWLTFKVDAKYASRRRNGLTKPYFHADITWSCFFLDSLAILKLLTRIVRNTISGMIHTSMNCCNVLTCCWKVCYVQQIS